MAQAEKQEILGEQKESSGGRLQENATAEYIKEFISKELVCSICTEIIIHISSLDCGHVFCRVCIEKWMVLKKECPICRKSCSTAHPVTAMDRTVQMLHEVLFTTDDNARRNELLSERLCEINSPTQLHGQINLMIPSYSDRLSIEDQPRFNNQSNMSNNYLDSPSGMMISSTFDSTPYTISSDDENNSIWPYVDDEVSSSLTSEDTSMHVFTSSHFAAYSDTSSSSS
ncbi:unnamed protein product [Protopolystoma xenopodis]|uniref:RING-type domain-containing protein n=1 Tax=Protopolystoma xenopodis TaxID=117903 RepID=A0A448WPS3_9PLAT|nr:unnamed protein product [Protopolystoma xenopodis]